MKLHFLYFLIYLILVSGPQGRRINRRVSWVSSLREPTDKSRVTLASRLKRQKLRLPRQRSFSLESELELRTVAKRAVGVAGALASIREARRSISLKSSPLHFPWSFRRESSSAMREGGVFAELRRSSEIFRNILLSIAGRDESTPTGMFFFKYTFRLKFMAKKIKLIKLFRYFTLCVGIFDKEQSLWAK